MNGSYIKNLNCKITLKSNQSDRSQFLDMYILVLSFWDALVWDTVLSANCPVTLDTTGSGPPDTRGAVAFKTPTSTIINANNYGQYKGSMSNHDKVYDNVVEVLLNGGEITTNMFEGLKTVEIIDKIYACFR